MTMLRVAVPLLLLALLAACAPRPERAVRIEPADAQRLDDAARWARTSDAAAAVADAGADAEIIGPLDDRALYGAVLTALGKDAAHYSVVVRRLHDGRGMAWQPDKVYYAASLFKLALLYEAERQRSMGLLSFDDRIEITRAAAVEDLGTLVTFGLNPGDRVKIGEAVAAMVTRSDNTSAVLLLSRFGGGRVNGTLAALGLHRTSVTTRDLPTTASDMARLMEVIARGTGMEPASREAMLALLARQETRWGIPHLLPAGVRVGNKTGTWPTATHDVAYVDAPGGAYVIAVLSDRGWVYEPIARVSRAVYDILATE